MWVVLEIRVPVLAPKKYVTLMKMTSKGTLI